MKGSSNKEEELLAEPINIDEYEDISANFETGKNFKEFFPHNNLELVLDSFKTKIIEPSCKTTLFSKRRKILLDSEKIVSKDSDELKMI